MTDEQALRVKKLIEIKQQLKSHIGFVDNTSVQWELRYRVKTGMYDGYPFSINPDQFELTEKEIGDFVAHKLRAKLHEVEQELKTY